jgi:ubiquinone/menaquinone biosynthesis C-methylase UbiE
MLAIARTRVQSGEFQVGDFYHLDFPDGAFDGFWAAASFLHVPKKDINIVVQEAKRILKSGGVGFVSFKQKTIMDEGYIKERKAGGIERYFAFYTKEEIKTILKQNGFQVLQVGNQVEKDGTVWLCCFIKKTWIP